MLPFITTAAIASGADVILFARIVGYAATPITMATVASISLQVTDTTKETALLGSGAVATLAPAVASSIYDALQQSDAAWQKDGAFAPGGSVAAPVLGVDGLYGYNFRYIVAGANTKGQGDRYQATATYNMVTGGIIKAVFQWPTINTYTG